jgi:hypothetical protein
LVLALFLILAARPALAADDPQEADATAIARPVVLHDDGRFEYGRLLAGQISGGKLHGVELSRGADGKPVTRAG